MPNPAGWEIGVYDVELAEAGAAWIAGTGAGFVHEGKERVQRVIKGDGEDRVDPGEEERKVMVRLPRVLAFRELANRLT